MTPAPPLADLDLPAVRAALAELGADGWLLFDFHGLNPVAKRVIGAGGLGTRRLFVFLPREGPPVAVAHRIELSPLAGFPGEVRPYGAWPELHEQLRHLIGGRTVAMEVWPEGGVPYLDRVPHGLVQLLESLGARIIPSGPLVSRFAARWTPEELTGHRRAAEAIAAIAAEALRWAGAELARGAEVRETTVQRRVLDGFDRAGLVTTHPPIVGFDPNAADPHYEPTTGADRRLGPGQVVLLDLWAGVSEGSVFADLDGVYGHGSGRRGAEGVDGGERGPRRMRRVAARTVRCRGSGDRRGSG